MVNLKGVHVVLQGNRIEPVINTDVSTAIAMLAVLGKAIAEKGGISTDKVFEIAKKGLEATK